MRMRSPIPKKHARIEIIPLIDIMFFLLASFMMVSLSQTHMKGISVNLPSANSPPQPPNEKKDYVSIRVTEGNLVYIDNVGVSDSDSSAKAVCPPRNQQGSEGFPQRGNAGDRTVMSSPSWTKSVWPGSPRSVIKSRPRP